MNIRYNINKFNKLMVKNNLNKLKKNLIKYFSSINN